ncbi:MAG: phosphate propanoyltransferase [Gemmatimonadota bacterium]
MSGGKTIQRAQVEALVREALRRYLVEVAPGSSVLAPAAAPGAPRLIANISARHCHLNQRAMDILFGPGSQLKPLKPLYQAGAFAAEQTVTVFGPRQQMIANLRILGPQRDDCQVELAFTDARFLGIEAPIRLSGDIEGTPGCFLVGPAGGLELSHGVIRAARHAHMSPAEAQHYGVKQGDRMRLVVEGEQGGRLDDILVRVGPDLKLEVHVDTDEGNAVDLVNATSVRLEKMDS